VEESLKLEFTYGQYIMPAEVKKGLEKYRQAALVLAV
jgi:hypothetical protein